MAVQAVHLESDAFLVCLNHALSTEKEEVMGLCIGEVDTSRIVHIHSVIILRRSDKRKDRVEISPEQLSAASTEAERLAEITGRPMRVVGWYHSHPHITVWPSHVDWPDTLYLLSVHSSPEEFGVRANRNPHPRGPSRYHWESVSRVSRRTAQDLVPGGARCLQKDPQPHSSGLSNQDPQWLSFHQESVQPDVGHQRAPPAVAGRSAGAEQAAGAGVTAGEGRAPAGTGRPGIEPQPDGKPDTSALRTETPRVTPDIGPGLTLGRALGPLSFPRRNA
ncbi:lys-63-specific deubiquitinase BRCC36 isoform X1 [Tachyglossus aculeatus]|uniref:lys-63-specific deubiquitinase BRCC36 isoform X1 n=1 Tax=Tachyglossus aculeatus TaxID=9261 RepID=UPI0018F64C9F|nr:lys-63-specific deubiquitinase BRCC36 isoform X1 [Tachyglossus aculeatus]